MGGVGVTGARQEQRGADGASSILGKCILCSVSNAGPLKIFKKTRLEEENKAAGKQGWLLQQWSRCRMTWT